MSFSVLVGLFLAIGLFWSVGMYNRVMRLRAKAVAQLGDLAALLQQYMALLQTCKMQVVDVTDSTCELAAQWPELRNALVQLERLFIQERREPIAARQVISVAALIRQLKSHQQSDIGMSADFSVPSSPEALLSQLDLIARKVTGLMVELHLVLSQYNGAVSQVPAKWVASVFGFEAAVTIL